MKNKSRKEQISKKIATLIREGVEKDQAVAIAFNMFKEGGKLPAYQMAGNFPQEKAQWDTEWNKKNNVGMGITDPNSALFYQTPPQDTEGIILSPEQLADDSPMINTTVNEEQRSRMAQNKAVNTATNNYDQDGNAKPFQRPREEVMQFFNPYGGFDIPTSAYMLGQGIESGDGFDIATSGLKLATGLGRNLMSGMGQARRRNYVMKDFQNTLREDVQPMWQQGEYGGYFQMGGTKYAPLQEGDYAIINDKMGIQFTPEFADEYFAREFEPQNPAQMSSETSQRQPIDLTKQSILDITSDGQFTNRKAWVTQKPEYFEGKAPAQEGVDYTVIPYKQWEKFKETEAYKNYKQPSQEQVVASRFQDGGTQQQSSPEEIIMAFAQLTQQDPQLIIEQLQALAPEEQQQALQQMMEAISQPMMQDGGEFKKTLTGEYTTEDKTAPSTEKVAELEDGEYLQKPDGSITKVIGKDHEEGGVELTDNQIPEGSKVISNHLKVDKAYKNVSEKFDLKINKTDTYSTVLDKWTKKSGLQDLVDEELEIIKKLEKETKKVAENPELENTTKINLDFLQKQLNEIATKKEPLEEQRVEVFNYVFDLQEQSKPEMQNGGDMLIGYEKYQEGGERFDDFYNQAVRLGYTGNKQIGEIQTWMAKNHPQEVINYYKKSGQPMNASHVDILKAQNKDVFEKAGIDPNKPSASYTSEEKAKLAEVAGDGLDDNFWLKGFQDNKWDWRAPNVPITATGATPQGMTGQAMNTTLIPSNLYIPQSPQEKEKNVTTEEGKKMGVMLLPDQSPMLSDSLQPALKATRRYNTIEASIGSSDAIIQEIRRQEQTAMDNIQGLPDAQRASAIAQIQANTQAEINKVMTQVESQNLMSRAQANQFNAQTQRVEEDAKVNDLLSYEQRILTADAKTQANLRNYYNTMKRQNVSNYNTIQNLNLLNQLYPNMAYTGDQVVATNLQEASNYNTVSQKTNAEIAEDAKLQEQKRLKDKRKAMGKNGGRFKTKY